MLAKQIVKNCQSNNHKSSQSQLAHTIINNMSVFNTNRYDVFSFSSKLLCLYHQQTYTGEQQLSSLLIEDQRRGDNLIQHL